MKQRQELRWHQPKKRKTEHGICHCKVSDFMSSVNKVGWVMQVVVRTYVVHDGLENHRDSLECKGAYFAAG